MFPQLSLLSAALFMVAASAASTSTDATDLPSLSTSDAQAATDSASSTSAKATTTATSATAASSTAAQTTGTITGSGSSAATGTVPTISGSSTDGATGLATDLPTIAGAYKIVAPSVPPTADAPYMQYSKLPEGTVFIAVGAILGFMALAVLLWRGLVAWALHRSVKRAAMAQNLSHEKSMFRAPVASFYRYKDHESSLSLANMKAANRKSSRPPTATMPGTTNQASLFFSPTAGAAGAGINQAGNRASSYLPAGYYAAGAAQAGGGHPATHSGNQQSISMTNLAGRDSYARAQSVGPSPPGTPSFNPHHTPSSSTVALNQPPGDQRAPSAYLEDLMDGPPVVPYHDNHRF